MLQGGFTSTAICSQQLSMMRESYMHSFRIVSDGLESGYVWRHSSMIIMQEGSSIQSAVRSLTIYIDIQQSNLCL